MKYEYTVDEDYPEGAREFNSAWTARNIDCVASDAAENYYDDELDPELFPLELELFVNEKSHGVFEIHLEFHPTFTAVAIDR